MLNPKEEKRFEELKAMCRELKVPAPPEIMIGLKVHDKNGVLTFDDVQRGHSWTRNFWNMVFIQNAAYVYTSTTVFGAGYLSCKRTGGYFFNTSISSSQLYAAAISAAAGGPTGYGIVVGTSDTAFSVEQTNLIAGVNTGNGSGQLAYQEDIVQIATEVAKVWSVSRYKIFNNNSGGSITIKEVGLIGRAYDPCLVERSVLSPTVAVANGAQLTVTYAISMDFSAID